MIVNKPRAIRIDLDPEQGFPTTLMVDYQRVVVENGQTLMELPPHTEALDPQSDAAKTVLGEAVASAIKNLLTYQAEVQRLATELQILKTPVTEQPNE